MMKRLLATFLAAIAVACFTLSGAEVRAADYSIVYSFQGSDGVYPSYSLIDVHGVLYGTTQYGGAGNCEDETYVGCGTVYSFDPATRTEKVLYSFQNYGTDGSNPNAPLTIHGDVLYGTTILGANENSGGGTIFRINIVTGHETMLYAFPDTGAQGCFPTGALTRAANVLYGTTSSCGGMSGGTLFSFVPESRHEALLYAFCSKQPSCADGGEPGGDLVYDGKYFFGTGTMGGGNNAGAIFRIDARNHKESVIHTFCSVQNCGDGAYPGPGLTYLNGLWYGTTESGGAANEGTVFSINLSTGALRVLHSFNAAAGDGGYPQTGLEKIGRKLYGTTRNGGGTNGCLGLGCGAVFSIDPKTGAETVLHGFCSQCGDGTYPYGRLLNVRGTLYGTTTMGGTGGCNLDEPGCGVIFALKP